MSRLRDLAAWAVAVALMAAVTALGTVEAGRPEPVPPAVAWAPETAAP